MSCTCGCWGSWLMSFRGCSTTSWKAMVVWSCSSNLRKGKSHAIFKKEDLGNSGHLHLSPQEVSGAKAPGKSHPSTWRTRMWLGKPAKGKLHLITPTAFEEACGQGKSKGHCSPIDFSTAFDPLPHSIPKSQHDAGCVWRVIERECRKWVLSALWILVYAGHSTVAMVYKGLIAVARRSCAWWEDLLTWLSGEF